MYDRIVILRRFNEPDGSPKYVTLGFFDAGGILQLEVPQVSAKLFPDNLSTGKRVVFNYPAKITEMPKK